MGLWNLNKVISILEERNVSEGRETKNLAGWIWEEIMGWRANASSNLDHSEEEKIRNAIDRVVSGEPVQYVAGHSWFYGMKLKVTPDVLIPRPETEELVNWVLADVKNAGLKEIRIIDIGTGSGCIAIALQKHLENKASILAIDVSAKALSIAKENALNHEVNINFLQRDFLKEGLSGLGIFDIIISNPPYVSRSMVEEEIINKLKYEPPLALYPEGDDPGIFYKKIAATGEALHSGSFCYMELNEFIADQVQSCFKPSEWSDMELRKDLQGVDRMLKVKYGEVRVG